MTKETHTEKIIHGDSLHVLKTMEDNSVDSVVCDPPYGLSKEPDINEILSKWLAGEEYVRIANERLAKEVTSS